MRPRSYRRLTEEYPEVDSYKLNYAQALYKGCMYVALLNPFVHATPHELSLKTLLVTLCWFIPTPSLCSILVLAHSMPNLHILYEGCGIVACQCGWFFAAAP